MSGWRIELLVPEAAVPLIQSALETVSDAQAAFETEPGGPWRVEGFCSAGQPDTTRMEAALAVAAKAAGIALPQVTLLPLDPIDWLAENQRSFPPIEVGRVFLHGSHFEGRPPATRFPLLIDAGMAFGSGEHATTLGCLMALQRLIKGRRAWPRRALDMGCGTGVLALALAGLTRRPVLAADIDSGSVRVARENVRLNRLAGLVRVVESRGYDHRRIRAGGPYDLILANILARPLCAMAPDLRRHLAPGGYAVLSGLLSWQERKVLAAHRAQGLHFVSRIAIDNWHTLIIKG